jgi:hypothetical protein
LPVFELVAFGSLLAAAWGYVIADLIQTSPFTKPRPRRGPPLPKRVRILVNGDEGADASAGASPDGCVFVYGRPWDRSMLRCAECKRSLSRPGEGCFLHDASSLEQRAQQQPHGEHGVLAASSSAMGGEGSVAGECLLCTQHFAKRHCTRCLLCGDPFDGRGPAPIVIKTGEAFCHKHRFEPPCYSCARPIGRADAASRPLCASCRTDALVSQRAALELVRELKGWFLSLGLDFGRWEPAQLRLVDASPGAHHLGNVEGLAHRAHGPARMFAPGSRRDIASIDLLHGLPRAHAAQVLVHELAHAWLWLQDYPAETEGHAEEGLCQLFAYLWLLTEEAREASSAAGGGQAAPYSARRNELLQRIRVMEQNSDRTYGGGFRDALRLAEQRGLHRTLEYVRAHGRLPAVAPEGGDGATGSAIWRDAARSSQAVPVGSHK